MPTASINPKRIAIVACVANLLASITHAADTACEVTFQDGGLIDPRSFPVTPGETVLNGRTDGNPSVCVIIPVQNPDATVSYPNGMTINSDGTALEFRNIESNIAQGLTVDDGGQGTGKVTFRADRSTSITGPVNITNNATLELITYNSQLSSSTTRLNTDNAYFSIEGNSSMISEFKLGDKTGGSIAVGAISGAGDIHLNNVGTTSQSGTLAIRNGDGNDYTYSGDIIYANQGFPSLTKSGAGTFTFTGDVLKAGGDTIGFTDGFGQIVIREGALRATTKAFVAGTKVQLDGGDLILEQALDGTTTTAVFQGSGKLIKRGPATISSSGIDAFFQGDLEIEEGTFGLIGSANLSTATVVRIDQGATLDLTQVGNSVSVSRITGNGTIALGGKTLNRVIRIRPGASIGVLNVTGSGTVNLDNTLIDIELDPTQAGGNAPGITHDQLAIAGSVDTGSRGPLIKLSDVQKGSDPSAFLNGREFTIITAGSGLTSIPISEIVEDTNSFHAFVGADPLNTTITDNEITVRFGIKTAQQVATAAGTSTIDSTNTQPGQPTQSKTDKGSIPNKTKAAEQSLQKTTGLIGNQKPTQQQLSTNPALQNLTTPALATASNNNNPEAYSSNITVTLEYADLVANIAMDNSYGRGLAMQQLYGEGTRQGRIWGVAAYVDGDIDGDQDATGNFDYNLGSFVFGGDFLQGEHNTFGAYGGAGLSTLDEHDHIDQDIDGRIFHFGLYDHYRFNNDWHLNGIASVFYADYESERRNLDTAGSKSATSAADYSSLGITLGIKGSRSFEFGSRTLVTPALGLTYTHVEQDSIRESAGGAAYDYEIADTSAATFVLGAGVDSTYVLREGPRPLVADLRLRYEYDAYADKNAQHDIQAGLAGQPKDTFIGENRGKQGLLIGLGLAGNVTEKLTIGAGYIFAKRSNGKESSVGANFIYAW